MSLAEGKIPHNNNKFMETVSAIIDVVITFYYCQQNIIGTSQQVSKKADNKNLKIIKINSIYSASISLKVFNYDSKMMFFCDDNLYKGAVMLLKTWHY